MENVNEAIEILEELIRQANSLINPISIHDDLRWLSNEQNRTKLFEEKPECFFFIKLRDETPYFPICNRSGMVDPNIVKFSIKLANKLYANSDVDKEHLAAVIIRLNKVLKKHSGKCGCKSGRMAYKKGLTTRNLNQVKQNLQAIRMR